MANFKNAFICVWFQIGVNVIGIPDFAKHDVFIGRFQTQTLKSKFHR
jgi:hypothetical protein